jgi:hypothetical protein
LKEAAIKSHFNSQLSINNDGLIKSRHSGENRSPENL